MSHIRTPEEREQWAEDHGYKRGKCPRCRRTIWSDSLMECSCGWAENEDKEPEDE